MKKVVTLIIAIAIPLIVGGISAALSAKGMATYGEMAKPLLSPPPWVFSVAWTILYIMMGVASFYVFETQSNPKYKMAAFIIYAVQLAINFAWSIIFFNKNAYLFAFLWLVLLWVAVVYCAYRFFLVRSMAGYLMIPYIAWLTFAAYLNLGTVIINMKA